MPSEVQERNVELLRSGTELGRREGLRGLYERYDDFYHPDFEWRPRMIGFGKDTYVGRDGFRQYVEDMEATFDEVQLTTEEIRGIGDDQALFLGRARFVGRGSGVPLESEWAILYRMEDGLARSGIAFDSHSEAEAAAHA